jgi:hypothetical protein
MSATVCVLCVRPVHWAELCQYHYAQRWHETTDALVKHGTNSAYTHRKCRCDACTVAHNAYQREYYERRKAGRNHV